MANNFRNAKLDLTQAEAVADLIASNTEAARKTALHNLKGGFSNDLQLMREKLIKFSALIELELDFSQEDVAFANKKELENLVQQLQLKTQALYDSFKLGNVIKNGVQVAIVGKPNAGKSTLLNALLNENRALVSAIPGTTRDTVEEYLNIQGVLYKLIDTAGIRMETTDAIEQMGIEKSREKIQEADIIIALFDASTLLLYSLSTSATNLVLSFLITSMASFKRFTSFSFASTIALIVVSYVAFATTILLSNLTCKSASAFLRFSSCFLKSALRDFSS